MDNGLHYSLEGQFILTEKWDLFGEIVGVNNLNGRNGDDPLSGLIETYYFVIDKIIWDAG